MKNPLGIHCGGCAVENPCPECHQQIIDEELWAKEHARTCEKPLGSCGVCAGVFGLVRRT